MWIQELSFPELGFPELGFLELAGGAGWSLMLRPFKRSI
jgi:hypothetical protein